ncbi:MAG: hypothetical protein JWM02_3255 [Frankiales bacterium]|nr:hypothetical protein [Frankiales bacterium]
MSGRIPEPPSPLEDEGVPDQIGLTPEQRATGQDEGYLEPPHDEPIAADEYGTTAEEQHHGEPLDIRLRRELPDLPHAVIPDEPFAERAGQGIGRLVEPDEGSHEDTEKDLIAWDVGTDLGGYSAEEAAMHPVDPDDL